ncbi:MAG TPA: carboxypeptidase regulatory-like domain-containing protein [Vicinamibacteria bacterium]|nr:carboxypeptidase regulatory-like domain-containing protein [Vicinamibacteria bacterium]
MHDRRLIFLSLLLAAALLLLPVASQAQSFNGSVSGTVVDPSGSAIAAAQMTLKNTAAGVELKRTSEADGAYAFRNLVPGTYQLSVTFPGFQQYQTSVDVRLNANVRLDVKLIVGAQTEKVEVVGAASDLSYSGQREDGIAPDTLSQLPLQMNSSGPRSSAAFVILMPGVTTGGDSSPYDARINGGTSTSEEAVLDGASMQEGFMSQGGMVAIYQDFPYSPDMVSEVKVITSTYEPQYGATTSGQVTAITKSGTDKFHGSAFEYFQDDAMNARQWGATDKSYLRKHNFGGNVGGPLKIPGLWSDSVKTYFYVDVEGYRQKGGATRSTFSIPSMKERNGDFSDWRDANGNLIPIYDPATTKVLPDGTVSRQPFPGNIIPADRITPMAKQWLQYLPTPTSDGPLNNYLEPTAVPDTILGDTNYFFGRFDTYLGQKDHIFASLWFQRAPAKFYSDLPHEISNNTYSDPQNSSVHRLNWDHTFNTNLLNHVTFGYLNRNEGYGSINADAVDKLPQIAGVAAHDSPPTITFSDGFAQWGDPNGGNLGNITTRPTYQVSDLLTWIKGSHTLKAGAEYRNIGGNVHTHVNTAGTFGFGRGATGILGENSGNPVASFLLGAVDNANTNFYTVSSWYPRQTAWIFHAGDTWNVNSKLTVNYGLRWDYFSPASEKYDKLSFLDPNGANPSAEGLKGRLAFAGNGYGSASYGAPYPETKFYGAFAPRLGASYALNSKTVLRAGWGIFYDRAYYPDWGGGMNTEGFNANPAFSSSLGGLDPAFYLQDGFPQDFAPPPFIQSDYDNGKGIYYRALDANQRARSQQWSLTVERQFGRGTTVSLAYVGTHGERQFSNNNPVNVLDPKYLSLGTALNDEFQSGQTSLHGVPAPYAGWVEQMQNGSCPPSLAQALLPYPQYCGTLVAMNENNGKTTYHSLQAKVEKRLSAGSFLLVSYTLSRIYTDAADSVQKSSDTWNGAGGVISPYEYSRNWALAANDVTHVLSAALVWDIPVGKGHQRLESGAANAILGGWTLSTIFRYSSAIPLYFRSSYCNVPGQFGAACIPSSSGNIFAQDKGSYDPNKGPLFNINAFQPSTDFNFNWGDGPRITTYRGFGYRNQDLSLFKTTKLYKDVNLQLRLEAFNIWNWHNFTNSGNTGNGQAFNTDIASPNFGQWSGNVTAPRVLQVSARFQF